MPGPFRDLQAVGTSSPQALHAALRPAAAPLPAAVGAGAEGRPESHQAGEEAQGKGSLPPRWPTAGAAEAGRAAQAALGDRAVLTFAPGGRGNENQAACGCADWALQTVRARESLGGDQIQPLPKPQRGRFWPGSPVQRPVKNRLRRQAGQRNRLLGRCAGAHGRCTSGMPLFQRPARPQASTLGGPHRHPPLLASQKPWRRV